jgi:ABC-type multidrug transport system fused ATPase/permease subunit
MKRIKSKGKRIINLGLIKIEKHIKPVDSKPKFIKIERKEESYKSHMESGADIQVLPPSMRGLAAKEEVVKPKLKKPKKFSKLVNEIDLLFDNVMIFNSMITAILLFLLFFIILMSLGINTIYAIIVPLIYIGVYVFLKLRENRYHELEKKCPELNEKVRTAVDNIYIDNEVVQELRKEVATYVKNVDYARFFSQTRSSFKILFIILLCFGIIFLAKYDVEYKLSAERVFGFMEGGEGNATSLVGDIISATTGGPDDDIFGEEYLADLGKDEVTIEINQVGYEINMDDVRDPLLEDFETSLFPDDVGVEGAEAFNQRQFEEHNELIKNYFKKMAQE